MFILLLISLVLCENTISRLDLPISEEEYTTYNWKTYYECGNCELTIFKNNEVYKQNTINTMNLELYNVYPWYIFNKNETYSWKMKCEKCDGMNKTNFYIEPMVVYKVTHEPSEYSYNFVGNNQKRYIVMEVDTETTIDYCFHIQMMVKSINFPSDIFIFNDPTKSNKTLTFKHDTQYVSELTFGCKNSDLFAIENGKRYIMEIDIYSIRFYKIVLSITPNTLPAYNYGKILYPLLVLVLICAYLIFIVVDLLQACHQHNQYNNQNLIPNTLYDIQ